MDSYYDYETDEIIYSLLEDTQYTLTFIDGNTEITFGIANSMMDFKPLIKEFLKQQGLEYDLLLGFFSEDKIYFNNIDEENGYYILVEPLVPSDESILN